MPAGQVPRMGFALNQEARHTLDAGSTLSRQYRCIKDSSTRHSVPHISRVVFCAEEPRDGAGKMTEWRTLRTWWQGCRPCNETLQKIRPAFMLTPVNVSCIKETGTAYFFCPSHSGVADRRITRKGYLRYTSNRQRAAEYDIFFMYNTARPRFGCKPTGVVSLYRGGVFAVPAPMSDVAQSSLAG